MEMLFSQEEVWEMERKSLARDAEKKGRLEGQRDMTNFYREFSKKMKALNRLDEMVEAMDDTTKLDALARELGLNYRS